MFILAILHHVRPTNNESLTIFGVSCCMDPSTLNWAMVVLVFEAIAEDILERNVPEQKIPSHLFSRDFNFAHLE